MKNHRFLWLRNRTTDNRKCEKARNIKEKRTIEMFNTVSRPPVALRSSPSAEFIPLTCKTPETTTVSGVFLCAHLSPSEIIALSSATTNLWTK